MEHQEGTLGEVRSPGSLDATLEKARAHFQPVLKEYFDGPAFVLDKGSYSLVPGACVVAILYLTRFIGMFGDLIEREDYRIDNFKQRNSEGGFGINESVLEEWKKAGCLGD